MLRIFFIQYIFWVAFFYLIFIVVRVDKGVFADTILPSKAIDIIKSNESKFNVLKWQCRSENYRIVNGNSEKMPHYTNAEEVIFDLNKKIYKVRRSGVSLTANNEGKETLVPFISEISFDGKIYCEWYKSGVANQKQTNSNSEGFGVVSVNQDDCTLNKQFIQSGYSGIGMISGMPAIIHLCQDLSNKFESISDFLQNCDKNNKIESSKITSAGVIKFVINFDLETTGYKIPIIIELDYDSEVCSIIRQRAFYRNTSPVKEYSILSSNFIKKGNANYPQKITFKQIFSQVTLQTDYYFDSFQYNPAITKDSFSLNFPDGIYVDDHVAKKYYRVGDVVEEDRKTDDFMTRRGLTGDIPIRKESSVITNYIFMSIGGLMIIAGIVIIIRKWKLKT
ncbi:MAG: hypothetical protein LBP59_17560 [Planctomycetaceae bacterium]|jgi:hypothetical protein|nr:hypothetical protein [Planctomycetaceae bacterium]